MIWDLTEVIGTGKALGYIEALDLMLGEEREVCMAASGL